MADNTNPTNNGISSFLPRFYRTDSNKKFLQATIEQLVKPGKVKKINGYLGRRNAKASTGDDTFVAGVNSTRENYQLEPSININDELGNTTFFKDYQDYINQLGVFGADVSNHARLNKQEFYSWNPHIDWDKFVNFQQYYWLPYGPSAITIYGQQRAITSTYTVKWESALGSKEFLFTPNGITRNPSLKLYRGQEYHFEIDSPGEPFSIKTSRSSGNLDRYSAHQSVDQFAVENGTITFTVPDDAPDVLFYVSENDINLGGVFQILDIKENTAIDVSTDLLGKKTYTLPTGLSLSNGMKVRFGGNVTPAEYATGDYYVEGVGTTIKLVAESDLELIYPYTDELPVLFDDTTFDSLPFGSATAFAGNLDYIVINRASKDKNPWSRYNRWFHQDVINASAAYNGSIASLDQTARAVRPIIEFEADLKLFNFGLEASHDVDLIDDYTSDIFSTIEGTSGYNVDGVQLAEGQRILFIADTDSLVNNKTYRVSFITVQNSITGTRDRQLHLVLDDEPILNRVAVVKQGTKYQGSMFWFNGTNWQIAQNKLTLNQPPLFDIVNNDGVSFGDSSTYDGTTFTGTTLFSYKVGTGTVDSNLGFPLSYKNINNTGDIVFNFNIITDTFQYKDVEKIINVSTSVGYLVKSLGNNQVEYKNGWEISTIDSEYQPAVRIYKNSSKVNTFDLDIFDNKTDLADLQVRVYVNGIRLASSDWILVDGAVYKKLVLSTDIALTDVLTIKAFAKQSINSNGFYEIPVNLQNNPLNNTMGDFTLGEVIDHVNSIVDNSAAFTGTFPGSNNLRDLGNLSARGTKFVQHSGPLSLALYHITSPDNNIIKAIETARDNYGQFKRNFIAVSQSLGIDTATKTFVDLILQEMNKDKPSKSAYYFSDMIPYGAVKVNTFTVIDYRILTYPLSETFDLNYLSNKAVGVYLTHNNETTQLLYGRDYEFDSQGFVRILAAMANDDSITVYEYDNTDGCFVAPTPTKLGIWPKFEPKIYIDTSLITPRKMIQGHDGSQVLAYSDIGEPNDYRDELLLELEKRIYNNIKVTYDPSIFDMLDIIPGYNRTTDYSLAEFNQVLAPNFYNWTTFIDRDFTKPMSFDKSNSLTFNYRGQQAPDGREVPGYWRGVYRWMLDTDRPNLCPWEMLGYSEEPAWWVEVYGPAPYTCDNIVMWNDLSEGITREPGKPIQRNPKFVRPFLTTAIPVDESGNLRSPMTSNFASGLITGTVSNDFVFGDVSPIEAAWRRSSYYAFSVLTTALLLKPAKTFGVLFDRSRIVRNLTGQLIYKDTGLRVRPEDIALPNIYASETRTQTAGVINYLVDYILGDNLKSYDQYVYDLGNIKFNLSYRVSGFTSKEKFNLLLDSKSPTAVGGVFVPQENYNVVLNSSSPVKKITYSGVIITKLSDGFEVKGYSKTQPYFKYYAWTQSGATINVGGISESYVLWSANQRYSVGKVVRYSNLFFRTTITHTSTETFNAEAFQRLPALPVSGGQDATFRKRWDRTEAIVVPFGTKFRTIQEVVDFLTGYGEWLKDQGFVFDDFNNSLAQITNWETSAKEFLFWTTQNWSSGEDKWEEWLAETPVVYGSIVRYNGDYYRATRNSPASTIFEETDFVKLEGLSTVGSSVISLSPSANKITIKTEYTVVDDILNQFNGYEIFKVDGTKLEPAFVDSFRDVNTVAYTPKTTDGIYGATFFLVQREQVVILDNTTLFNDTIYNPESGYRQERIKTSSYVSTDWYGGFDVPGFIFDQAKIQEWNSWTDYALGDIVKYKEFYYSANYAITGTAEFVASDWVKLDSKPSARLIPNWSYKASQFEDFYSLDSGNFDIGQQKVAQHLIGYQKRQYLSNIIKDDVSEFKFYQGMIIEKGTQNSLNKLFDVLSADGEESLKFFEEWAVCVGQYGATAAFEEIEFILDESKFTNNPQGFELVQSVDSTSLDFIIRQTPNDVYLKPLGYNSNPWPMTSKNTSILRTAGYVRNEDVKLLLDNIDDIVNESPIDFTVGDYVWCAFEGREWNIYRYSVAPFKVTNLTYSNSTITVTTDEQVRLSVGSFVSIVRATGATGFYKIKTVSLNSFTVSATLTTPPANPFTEQSTVEVFFLETQRVKTNIDDANDVIPTRPKNGEKIWSDNLTDDQWAVWEYNTVYTGSEFSNSFPADDIAYGRSVAMNTGATFSMVSTNNAVVTYDKVPNATVWLQRQTIFAPFICQTEDLQAQQFGYFAEAMAIAASKWVAIGSPNASAASTLANSYTIGEIAVTDITGTSSGFVKQGVVTLYTKDSSNVLIIDSTIVSPNSASNEQFGSSLVFGSNELFVAAVGYNSGEGCVYRFVFNDGWKFASIISESLQANAQFGYAIALSEEGTLVISAPGANSVFVYAKNEDGEYELATSPLTATDNRFGESVAVTTDGNFIAVGSKLFDGVNIDQGQVVVYDRTFAVHQQITSPKPEIAEFFGSKVLFSNNDNTLVIFSANGDSYKETTFNVDGITTFDNNSMRVIEPLVDSGRVDVFDRYNTKWVYSETLGLDTDPITGEFSVRNGDAYGASIAVGLNTILVGSPYTTDAGLNSGKVFGYTKPVDALTWKVIRTAVAKPDITKIKKAFLYNKTTNNLVTYLDVLDPVQGKIPGIADQEIKFKTFFDPAVYSVGTDEVIVDNGQAWTTEKVGMLWWDQRRAKFIDSYGGDVVYRNTTWNTMFETASIDIYEWIETTYLPEAWNALADTEAGLTSGISGTSLYGNNVYSVKKRYDTVSQTFKNTYFYWVKNKKIIPNVASRQMSASDVSNLIANPKGQGYKYIALTGSNSFSLVNVKPLLENADVVLAIQYWTVDNTQQNIHSEWRLVSEDINSDLPKSIELKWFDSLCGKDEQNRVIPDLDLPPKLRYGAQFRPRQSMFVNRFEALKQFVERANSTLLSNQIVNSRDITDLNSFDLEPSIVTGLYDTVVDTDAELRFASVSTVKLATVTPVVTNGYITGVEIVEPGNGYLTAPYITVHGNGEGAVVRAVINARGQITGIDIINKGYGYDDSTVFLVRNYSVLVHSDEQALGRWSIYAYDPINKVWSRTQSQSYDTRKYWTYVDWYAPGLSQFTVVDHAVDTISDIVNISVNIGQLVKVRTSGSAGWSLLKKYANSDSVDWTQSYNVVGSQNGTIQLSDSLYKFSNTTLGYDGALFDGDAFDNTAVTELRIILNSLKTKIFIDTLKQTYLDLFFACLRYAFTEQNYIDWAFKTSFVRVQHNVGALRQKVTYNNDNLVDFESYIQEVKPYRTKIREYVSEYTAIDNSRLSVTDFDVQPIREAGQTTTMTLLNVDGDIQSTHPEILQYPWKHWLDNVGFEITEIVITNNGSGYLTPPTIRFEGGYGTGATAKAFISSGRLNRILLLTPGTNFLAAPKIIVDGGLAVDGVPATAIAKIGNSVVRSNLIKMKFDRVSKTYFITELEETATFAGTGSQLQFVLKWAPDVRIGTSAVTINGVDGLRDSYVLATAKSTAKGYTSYYGTITFKTAPAKGTSIVVSYIKDWALLNAADRINFYYDPTTGQLGKDLSQLMTGVDYGGTIITGLDFNVSAGWDSLPYFSDAWDSIDPTFDDYIIKAGLNSNEFTLPYIPGVGEEINVYHNGIRLDDLAFGTPEQTNLNATMQTFIGDGINSTVVLPSIAVTRSADGTQSSASTVLTLSSVAGIQVGSLLLAPDVVPANTTVTAVTGNLVSITSTGEISGTTLTMPGLTDNYVGMRVTGNTVLPNTYIVSVTPGVSSTIETQIVEVSGTAINAVTFLGQVVATSAAGDTAADIVIKIAADNSAIMAAWNASNPTQEIENIEIDFENGPIQGAGSTTLRIVYRPSEGDVPVLSTSISNGITFAESVALTEGVSGAVSTAQLSISQTVGSSSLTFLPIVEISNPLQGEVINGYELFFGDTIQYTLGVQPVDSTKIAVSSAFNVTVGDAVYSPNKLLTTTAILTGTTVTAVDLVANTVTLSAPISSAIADSVKLSFGYNKLFFRKSTSDGAIKPLDTDYDTAISGGDLAYSSATGLAADDIILDGDDFVTATSSDAPEEVVPGQITDAVAIKVFYRPTSGSANIKVDNHIADGQTAEFSFSQALNSSQALLVKVDGDVLSATDYVLNYNLRTITLNDTPLVDEYVSIFSFGFNGQNVLDIDYFVGNSATAEFITKAPWIELVSAAVYINGVAVNYELFRTDSSYDQSNVIGIRFGTAPLTTDVINYVIVAGDDHAFSTITTETLVPLANKTTFTLTNQVGTSTPLESSMIVRIDQAIIPAANNSYFNIVRNKLNYTVDQVKMLPYALDISNVAVYADNVLLNTGLDYSVDLSGITVTINKQIYSTYKGKVLTVSINTDQAYTCTGSEIIFAQAPAVGQLVEVTSAFKHDVLDIQRTNSAIVANLNYTVDTPEFYAYTGLTSGLIPLDRPVINSSYVWVTKNTQLLTPSIDYKLTKNKQSILLDIEPVEGDKFEIITFSSNVQSDTISYMQFKDMLNRTHFKRLSLNKQTTLARKLRYNDTDILLADASNFDEPNPSRNLPGVIEINGERIEYFVKNGNMLSQLRRGTLGTGTPRVNPLGTSVQDIGPSETIPYKDTISITQVASTGSNLIGTDFTPLKSSTPISVDADFVTSIPANYGQADNVEVFVGGYAIDQVWATGIAYTTGTIVNVGSYLYRCVADHTSTVFSADSANWMFFVGNIRLKKHAFKVHNVNQHPDSPEGDIQMDPDFTVDGVSNSIRLTNALDAGTTVTIVKRVGKMWTDITFNPVAVTFDTESLILDSGQTTVDIKYSNTLQDGNKQVAEFLKATPGIWHSTVNRPVVGDGIADFDAEDLTFDTVNTTYDKDL